MNDGEVTFGFIGFGEVAASFSEAMLRRGATVWAFDHKLHDKGGLKTLKARSRAPGVSFADMPEIANNSTVLLSTVTPGSALEVALSCVKFLDRRHTYIDLNSIDPNRKRLIARIVSDAGASFLEGAILKSVRTFGPKARVLLCGQRSITMTEVFNRYGIDAEALGKDIGRASTFKLLRSTFSKSCEPIILETLIAAELAGMREEVWSEIVSTFAGDGFRAVAESWIVTHVEARRRRLDEIGDVVDEVQSYGLSPIMTHSAYRFFERSLGLNFADVPRSASGVVRAMADQLKQ